MRLDACSILSLDPLIQSGFRCRVSPVHLNSHEVGHAERRWDRKDNILRISFKIVDLDKNADNRAISDTDRIT